MQALFIVINHEKHFDSLLDEFRAQNIHGGTILESEGLATTIAEHSHDMNYGYFRSLLNSGRPYNKTIFLIGNDQTIQKAKECVRKVTGGISEENKGIMFTIAVNDFEGLTK
ncbi:MAG: hypothetical protein Q4Q17_03565 [Tissierellia bacterium]|nr:hypothetical protein [Tissierellia bacterium]